jgi:hypothetical protein
MAFSPVPTNFFASWSENGTTISVPIASFPEMTAAEADGATGDIRKILYAICERCWSVWNALATADKPTKMTIGKSSNTNVLTGKITHQYTFTFINSVSAQDVDAE